jgi:hypothetical protein
MPAHGFGFVDFRRRRANVRGSSRYASRVDKAVSSSERTYGYGFDSDPECPICGADHGGGSCPSARRDESYD